MTEPHNKMHYIDFVTLTTELYEHCTLNEKLTVYVQHRPNGVVGFLQELIEEVGRLEGELGALQDQLTEAHDQSECLSDEIDDLEHRGGHS